MAKHEEVVLIQHLVLTDSLLVLVREPLDEAMLPTEELRPLLTFARDYWFAQGSLQAPSPEAMRLHYGTVLAEHEIDLDTDPTDTLTFALEAIRNAWIDRMWQAQVMKVATSMATAPLADKASVLNEGISLLMTLHAAITPQSEQTDVRVGATRVMEEYDRRLALRTSGTIEGLISGHQMIDEHTSGIRPGELAVLAAPPKVGKSWWLLMSALATWRNGGTPVLFSLENSIQMMLERLACLALGIDARRWQRAQATDDEVARVREWIAGFEADRMDRPFWILQPEIGKRTVQHLIRQGLTLGDSIFIDQLTFVEVSLGAERKSRSEQIGQALHEMKSLIASRTSVLLAHQINREGQKAAEKAGRLEMYHLAESAEVERTADWVFGQWQSRALRDVNRMQVQSLAARREDLVHWEFAWRPWIGQTQCLHTITLDDQ